MATPLMLQQVKLEHIIESHRQELSVINQEIERLEQQKEECLFDLLQVRRVHCMNEKRLKTMTKL